MRLCLLAMQHISSVFESSAITRKKRGEAEFRGAWRAGGCSLARALTSYWFRGPEVMDTLSLLQ
jgi:hypothetical protein